MRQPNPITIKLKDGRKLASIHPLCLDIEEAKKLQDWFYRTVIWLREKEPEKILSIEEFQGQEEGDDWSYYDGYKVTTTHQVIYMAISNGQSCCEDFGYFHSEDNLDDFKGAQLIDIKKVDTAKNVEAVEKHGANYLDSGDIMFITFVTSKGEFQLAAYNSHNGYYGHEAKIVSKQLTEEGYL